MAKSLLSPLRFSLLSAFIIFLVFEFADIAHLTKRLENISYDFRVKLTRSNKVLPTDISVILIDDPALQMMSPVVGRWPWPRSIYRDIIEYLSLGQPKAIMFDLLFSEQQLSPGQDISLDDKELITATQEAGNLVHAMQFLENDRSDQGHINQAKPLTASLNLPRQNSLGQQLDPTVLAALLGQKQPIYTEHILPITDLQHAANHLGVVNAITDKDGVYRRAQPLYPYHDAIYPALSIAALDASGPGFNALNRQLLQVSRTTPPGKPLQVLLNFHSDYSPISMSGLLNSIASFQAGEIENLLVHPDEFRDKFIFIGASAIGLHDLKATPLDKLAPGVFIHASLLANTLENDFLLPVPAYVTSLAVYLLALLTAYAVLATRSIVLQVTLPLSIAITYFAICLVAMHENWVMEFVPPFSAILIAWLAAYVLLLSTEENEKKQIRKMFSRYVSPAALAVMVDQFEEYKSVATGSQVDISVLFSDIRGFTGLSEQLPAVEVVTVLNHYFSVMTEVVFRHDGTVDKFIGDAIMATWGAPIRSASHAQDAVAAAMSMCNALSTVNQWLRERNLPTLGTGIGIHSGEAVMGSIGSQQKADFTVIGDTVNLSSRLEGLTKAYGYPILLSDATFAALEGRISCQILDRVQVKGKQESICIYAPIFVGVDQPVQNPREAEQIALSSRAAFEFFQAQQWHKAISLLNELPDPYRNRQLIEKCRHCINQPPDESWDGVTVMQNK